MEKLTLIFLITMSIFGCISFRNKPDVVVEKYYKALSAADYDTAISLICELDKKRVKGISRRFTEIAMAKKYKLFADLLSLRKYEIGETKIRNNRAYVDIKISEPLLSKEVLEVVLSRDNGSLKELISKEGLPMTTKTETVNLVKEKDGWRISLPYTPPEGHF